MAYFRDSAMIGKRIRDAREAAKFTQGELAKRLNPPVSHAAVSDLENGKTRISMDRLGDIARALDLDVSELWSPEPSEPPKGVVTRAHYRGLLRRIARLENSLIEAIAEHEIEYHH